MTAPLSPRLATQAINSVEALQSIIDVLATPVFVKDRDHRWVLVNRALCDFMGRAREELIGKSDYDFQPREQADVFWQKDDLVFTTGQENENEEVLTDRDGDTRTIVTRKTPISIAGAPLLVAVITDITAFREAEKHSNYLAHHDMLSGLANRTLLGERLDALFTDPAARGKACSALVMDLDRFKQVNDAFGHATGDELIRQFARRLTGLVSADDIVARIGGDEFAVVVFDDPSSGAIDDVCSVILEVARVPYVVAGAVMHVGVSIGTASVRIGEASRCELVRRADVALNSAKTAGRDCCRTYDAAIDQGRVARVTLEGELRAAIAARKDLVVHYQPLYSGDRIIGLEALLRWNHPERGLVPPAAFVPIAEETGLIVSLGDLVLDQACAALADWPGITMAINISAVQLRDPNLAMRIMRRLAVHGIPTARIEIEVTESVLLNPGDATEANLAALRAAGIRIALDDFGTGYSSLSYLQDLKIDSVKIDQSFVSHLGQSTDSAQIIQAIVHLARILNLKVVAEGVETEAQRRFLVDAGCSILQGYLLSPPLPAEKIGPLLARQGDATAAAEQDAA